MRRMMVLALLPALACMPAAWAQQDTADLLFINGAIYTVDEEQPWAEAVAIVGNRIVFVGTTADAQRYQGPGTEVVDLAGQFVLPGLHDSHIHPLEAFHGAWTCFLPPGRDPEEYLPVFEACAPRQIGTDWVIGFGHSITSMLLALNAGGRDPVEILSEAIPDRPAVMLEGTSHSVWVNRLALEAAGIDGDTPDPPGGVILRDPVTRAANGLLLDGAGEIVLDLAFAPSPAMAALNEQALRDAAFALRRQGITSFADARVHWRRGYVEAYRNVAAQGALTARAVLGLWAYPYLDDDTQVAQLAARYDDPGPGARVRITQVKAYADGEVSHTTAALIAPYRSFQLASPRGLNYFDPPRLARYLTPLEVRGFDFHIHTIGDRGVRGALDVIEGARAANGDLGARHRLTHLEVVAPKDIDRFAQLGVIADVQMSSDFVLAPPVEAYGPYLGPRRARERVLRLRDLWESGAQVVLSSDFDVGSLSPFVGMRNALTRGDQRLPDLDAAIRAYTLNAAYLMRHEAELGSLAQGKLADLVVVDRNLFHIEPSLIGEARVRMTVVDGEIVYERD